MANTPPSSAQFGEQLFFEPLKSLEQSSGTAKAQSVKKAKAATLFGGGMLVKPFKFPHSAYEYKVVALRECPAPEEMLICDTSQRIADYWRLHVATHPHFDPERECFVIFLVNARRRIKGHQMVSTGTLDSVSIHARDVFRLAITAAAASIILAHNHPSGEAQPSEADVRITRDLIRAGELMKIEVLDHVIIANQPHCSLKDTGYFFT